MNLGMSPWIEFDEKTLEKVPESLGVFLLARGEGNIAYVGRADDNLRMTLCGFQGKVYTHFCFVRLPWTKEAFEMQCRLYHHEGGKRRLDNTEHPMGPSPKMNMCLINAIPLGLCDV